MRARRLALPLIALLVTLGVAACGSGSGSLSVTLSGERGCDPANPSSCPYKPGDTTTITVDVTNTGLGTVSGVTIHVLLPPGFRYRSTTSITTPGATRTQPLDADVNSSTPIWGLWTIEPQGAAGLAVPSHVTIQFSVAVSGDPGTVPVRAFAAGDTTSGQTDARPLYIDVASAARLGASVTVSPSTVNPSGTVTYVIRVTNTGTGIADQVGVLVSLPPWLAYSKSNQPFAGNGTRNGAVDPHPNAVLPFFGGFTLPPQGTGGPGYVAISFTAAVVPEAVAGTYPVSVSLTDGAGDTFTVNAAAPLTII